MTEPVPARRGFRHKNVFYEYVPWDEWFNQDFILVRALTRVSVDEIMSGRDSIAIQQATFAVAVWHANPQQTMERILQFVSTIKPVDIEEVGFADEADDASPPDGQAGSANQNGSPETGESSSEPS